jgi:hypothetical protein
MTAFIFMPEGVGSISHCMALNQRQLQLVSHVKVRTQADGICEEGAEEIIRPNRYEVTGD